MDEQSDPQQIDHTLIPFLRAEEESESEKLLVSLITEQAEPLIKEIIGYKLRTFSHQDGLSNQEAEDVRSNVVLNLIARLREIKFDPARIINNFRSYVAVTTYNACNEHLRQKYPQRHALKNQLRYLFSHHPKLATWEDQRKQTVCGYTSWRDADKKCASLDLVNRVAGESHHSRDLIEMVTEALDTLDAPVEFDDMVSIIAQWTGISELSKQTNNSITEREAVDPRPTIDKTIEQRLFLERLWEEICQLPARQRVALLLNLKDEQGNNQLAMFPLTGVASARQIAAALDMSNEEFARLWNDLPLEDRIIAERLSITRQQVINLRKSARERLARRMSDKSQA